MKNLILRNTPDIADAFEIKEIEKENGCDVYEVYCENGKIVICGNCKISMAMG
ncbi:MAG: alpha-N-acetylglucosaminidase N-terminal domain-containing protein, partial [Clostridia bacterium]|nr:alpha-N-acetylglucosaminidase N-terminal domain-containing protein [Clostridia bacterium]